MLVCFAAGVLTSKPHTHKYTQTHTHIQTRSRVSVACSVPQSSLLGDRAAATEWPGRCYCASLQATHIQTDTQTNKHIDTYTQTHTHTYIDTHIPDGECQFSIMLHSVRFSVTELQPQSSSHSGRLGRCKCASLPAF